VYSVDVLVIGAGPAGSTIARLLAKLGYSVLLLQGPPLRHPVGSVLPPGIERIFKTVEIDASAAGEAVHRSLGSTAWWMSWEAQVEEYPESEQGFHVERQAFDAFLIDLARREGVTIERNSRAPRVALSVGAVEHDSGATSARFVVDATGRAGLLARQIRRYWDPCYRTMGLSGVFHSPSGWDAHPRHTLTEAFEQGWARSVPLAPDRRYVCLMLDSEEVRTNPASAFREALETTRRFRSLFQASELEGDPWGRDASLYYSDRCAGPNWLLTGDAASFVDPISTFGVRKALLSAWTGAIAVHTCLSNPEMAAHAVEYYNAFESAAYTERAIQSLRRFREAATLLGGVFWRKRKSLPDCVLSDVGEDLLFAEERLRQARTLHFRLMAPITLEARPALGDGQIVLMDRPVLRNMPERFMGIDLPGLAEIGPRFTTVDGIHSAYSERYGASAPDDVISALALLVAKRVLAVG
jgi:flavin-dependent dehydrogenase